MKRFVPLFFACVCFTLGCTDALEKELTISLESSHITCISAIITGTIENLNDSEEVGILLSLDSSVSLANSKFVSAVSVGADGDYVIRLSDLTPSTKYYWRSFTKKDNLIITGDVKSFTTRPLNTMIKTMPADSIRFFEARMNGQINMEDIPYKSINTGFFEGVNKDQLINVFNCGDKGDISIKLKDLQSDTKYYYCSFINVDGRVYYGDTLSFSTNPAQGLIQTLDATDITCLKASFNVELNISDVDYDTIEYGVLIGDTETPTMSYQTPCIVNILKPDTYYYYQAYLIINGKNKYLGSLKSFKTRQPWINDVDLSVNQTKTGIVISRNRIEEEQYAINAIVLRSDSPDVLDIMSKDIAWSQFVRKPFFLNSLYVDFPIGETVYGICLEDNYGNRTDTLKYKIQTEFVLSRVNPSSFKNAALEDDTLTSYHYANYPISALWDGTGISSVPHFFVSNYNQIPGWLTIDLGQTVHLYSISTLPRIGYMVYGGDHPRCFEFWGSLNPSGKANINNEHHFDDSWFCLGKFEQTKPSGYRDDGSVGDITYEDSQWFNLGNDFRFDPTHYPKCYDELKYLRVVITDTFKSFSLNDYSGLVFIGEITPYEAIK